MSKPLNLNCREQQVVEHLKEHRPKMYRELVQSGQLEATAKRMWEERTDQWRDLVVNHGLAADQAEELVREVAFPPDERDQPHLGENPRLPTTAKTTS